MYKTISVGLLAFALTGCLNPTKDMTKANQTKYINYTAAQVEVSKQPVVTFRGSFQGEFVYHGEKAVVSAPQTLKGNADVAIQLGSQVVKILPGIVSTVSGAVAQTKAVEALGLLGSKPTTANYNNSDVRTGEFNDGSKNIVTVRDSDDSSTLNTDNSDNSSEYDSDSGVRDNDYSDNSDNHVSDDSDNSDNSINNPNNSTNDSNNPDNSDNSTSDVSDNSDNSSSGS